MKESGEGREDPFAFECSLAVRNQWRGDQGRDEICWENTATDSSGHHSNLASPLSYTIILRISYASLRAYSNAKSNNTSTISDDKIVHNNDNNRKIILTVLYLLTGAKAK